MTINWNDSSHPIYALARILIYMTALTLLLMFNASDFDITEIRTIIPMFLIGAGSEGAMRMLHRTGA